MAKIRVGITVVALLGSALALTVWFGFVGLMVLGVHNLIN